MTIEIKKYNENDKDKWEELNLAAENSSFLSSTVWIEFQKTLGKEIDQYLIYANETLVGNLYIEISRRRIAKYAYSPYGPVIDWEKLLRAAEVDSLQVKDKSLAKNEEFINAGKMQSFGELFSDLKVFFKKYCKDKNVNLFKFDSLLDVSYADELQQLGFKKSLSPAQARDTWIMDLTKSEDEILVEQKKETRYYMKRAGKLGVEFIKASTTDQVKAFGELMHETTERKGFVNYSSDYYIKQFEALNKLGMTEVYLAKYKDKYIAGALINFYKDSAYYAHGASTSDPELSKLAAPYFLQWEIIKDAKQKGMKHYNFWGVLPKEIKNHPWRGLSDFKMKFSGELKSYVGSYETYASPIKYYANRLFDLWAFRKERY